MERSAVISNCGTYRYTLRRRWEPALFARGFVLWIMLNPSTADAVDDDATIRKCIGFTQRWKYGWLEVANLFALRSRNPAALAATDYPIGPENDAHLARLINEASVVMVGWGDSGPAKLTAARAEHIRQLVVLTKKVAWCLGKTATGAPKHPSRPGYATAIEVWA
jgi:hypothetical protein